MGPLQEELREDSVVQHHRGYKNETGAFRTLQLIANYSFSLHSALRRFIAPEEKLPNIIKVLHQVKYPQVPCSLSHNNSVCESESLCAAHCVRCGGVKENGYLGGRARIHYGAVTISLH